MAIEKPTTSTRIAVVVATAGFTVAVVVFARDHWGTIYDDALIYLRYVRNLDRGCGLRFNCNEAPVEGFTGPAYLLVLWLGSLATDQLISLCQVVDAIALVVAGGFAIATAARLGGRDRQLPAALALATALVLALDPYILLNASIGMETSLAAAAFSIVGFAAVSGRPRLLVAAAVASMLVRPEGALFVLALPIVPAMRRPRYLVPAVGAIVALALARWAYFGEPLPNTYYAKLGGTWRHAELGAAYIADAFADFPIVVLAPLALVAAAHRRACGYVLVASAAWLAFFLRSGGDTFEYSRLWFPLVPLLSVLALAGVATIAARLARWAAIAAPLACALLVGSRAAIVHAIPPQGTSARVVEWAAVGSYLRARYPRDALVATVPIGAIGYYSDLPVLDLVGLTDATIARAGNGVPDELLAKRWIGHERNDTDYVLARAPAVIVTTMHREQPWTTLADAKSGFWADHLLLEEIKAGRAPYHVLDAEVLPGDHVLMFERDP